MKINILISGLLMVGIVQFGSIFADSKSDATQLLKLANTAIKVGVKSIPDALQTVGDVMDLVPVLQSIDANLAKLKEEKKKLKDTEGDKQALESNKLRTQMIVTNMTTLLSSISTRVFRILKGATPLLQGLVDNAGMIGIKGKDLEKAQALVTNLEKLLNTISSITKKIYNTNQETYEKMVAELTKIDKVAAEKAEKAKEAINAKLPKDADGANLADSFDI